MFEGVLPDNISVYATTASNAFESSWGTYCPGGWVRGVWRVELGRSGRGTSSVPRLKATPWRLPVVLQARA